MPLDDTQPERGGPDDEFWAHTHRVASCIFNHEMPRLFPGIQLSEGVGVFTISMRQDSEKGISLTWSDKEKQAHLRYYEQAQRAAHVMSTNSGDDAFQKSVANFENGWVGTVDFGQMELVFVVVTDVDRVFQIQAGALLLMALMGVDMDYLNEQGRGNTYWKRLRDFRPRVL